MTQKRCCIKRCCIKRCCRKVLRGKRLAFVNPMSSIAQTDLRDLFINQSLLKMSAFIAGENKNPAPLLTPLAQEAKSRTLIHLLDNILNLYQPALPNRLSSPRLAHLIHPLHSLFLFLHRLPPPRTDLLPLYTPLRNPASRFQI